MFDKDIIMNNAEYLNVQEYMAAFKDSRNNLKKCMRKYEGLQTYGFLNEKNYLNYLSGDKQKFCEGLIDFKNNTQSALDLDKSLGIETLRLRYVKYPLETYLLSQYYIYCIIAKLGTKVRYISNIENVFSTMDFICFDVTVCYFLDFTKDKLNGAWKVTNSEFINKIVDEFDNCFSMAKKFEYYYQPDQSIIEILKKDDVL